LFTAGARVLELRGDRPNSVSPEILEETLLARDPQGRIVRTGALLVDQSLGHVAYQNSGPSLSIDDTRHVSDRHHEKTINIKIPNVKSTSNSDAVISGVLGEGKKKI